MLFVRCTHVQYVSNVCMYYVCMYLSLCMYVCTMINSIQKTHLAFLWPFYIYVLSISIFLIIGSGGGLSEESKAKLASLLKKLRNSQDPAAILSRPCPPLEGLPVR